MWKHQSEAYSKNSQLPAYRAMRKYNHRTEIWADNIDDRELLCQMEIQAIAQLKDAGIELYNLTDRGGGTSGWKHTCESKKKISKAHKGKIISDKHKEILKAMNSGDKNPMYGKTGMNSPHHNPMSYYETNSVQRKYRAIERDGILMILKKYWQR